ncbi:MAG: NAD-binding protein [Candidatus Eremiobacteraeota bacterium]|nr:NAD-binding protein [Candidatus Eremiobacteraeota bacterium]
MSNKKKPRNKIKALLRKTILILSRVKKFFLTNQLVLLFVVVSSILFLGSTLFFFVERGNNEAIKTPFDSIYWIIVTMSTVGYGDISPTTLTGRFIAMVIMFVGVSFMGLFSATIASGLVERDIKGGMGMLDVDLEDHVVVCGWNHNACRLIENILESQKDKNIVILANLQSKPIQNKNVYFVKGDPTNEVDLHRANIERAETAIVLLDTSSGNLESADARTILTTLAIETINSDVYTCAEILDSKNLPHLRNARVDEVITSGEFSGRLMAHTAVSHGISKVISEILTRNEGSDLQKVSLPDEFAGKPFDDLFKQFRDKENSIILVAIERNKEVFVNPEKGFDIEEGDNAILICRGTVKTEDLL